MGALLTHNFVTKSMVATTTDTHEIAAYVDKILWYNFRAFSSNISVVSPHACILPFTQPTVLYSQIPHLTHHSALSFVSNGKSMFWMDEGIC